MKKIVFFVVFSLSFLLFYSVQAQEIKPDKVISASFNTPVEINDQEWKTDFKDVISDRKTEVMSQKFKNFMKKYYPSGLDKKSMENFVKRVEELTGYPWACATACLEQYQWCLGYNPSYPARAICDAQGNNCLEACFPSLPAN